MSAFGNLMNHFRDTAALEYALGIVNWDKDTMMPRPALTQRSVCMGVLTKVVHERWTADCVARWLADIDEKELDEVSQAQFQRMRRTFLEMSRVPVELSRAKAEAESLCEGAWRQAREQDQCQKFFPSLEEVLSLAREEGTAIADGGNPYDALLGIYEPEMTSSELDVIFGRLKPHLISLRESISPSGRAGPRFVREFPEDQQLSLARELANRFGYDVNKGRLDLTEHPFCCGTAADVRITTRVDLNDPYNCLYSTIHESGHASYEANIQSAFLFTPIGSGTSMGVHESQSRICENQLGRSRAFTTWLYSRMMECFGDIGIESPEEFYRHANRLRKGYIRTESDEVQYNLHIILRYELERDLILGRLEVRDLEEAWNKKFLEFFGYEVDRPTNGVLQDVHWAVGLFGYFPTYTLGNIYAGCLFETMQEEIHDLDGHLEKGDVSPATDWLRTNVHQFGGLRLPKETVEFACKSEISERPLLDYLDRKYSELR